VCYSVSGTNHRSLRKGTTARELFIYFICDTNAFLFRKRKAHAFPIAIGIINCAGARGVRVNTTTKNPPNHKCKILIDVQRMLIHSVHKTIFYYLKWSSGMFDIVDHGNGVFIVKMRLSEVHTLDVPELKEKLQQAIINKGIRKMVVDLSSVKMITSSGIGIFLNINQSLKSNLRLASPNAEVQKVLELTKVTSVIKVFDTIEAALQSL
jgi:anti-anti-sigma factor